MFYCFWKLWIECSHSVTEESAGNLSERVNVVSDAFIHHITDEVGIVATDPVAKLVLRVKCIYNQLNPNSKREIVIW